MIGVRGERSGSFVEFAIRRSAPALLPGTPQSNA